MPIPSSYEFDIAVGTIAIMITIGGIALGLGLATNNRRLKEFGRDEINQSVINGILVGGMLVLFLPSGPIYSLISQITLASGAVQCPEYLSNNAAICFANGYLTGSGYALNGVKHSSILSRSTELILGLLGLNTIFGLLASVKVSFLAVSFSLGQVLSPILSQIQFFIKALTTVSISALVQSSILSAISATALVIILPSGLVLRTFYPTRKVGGFLVGAALGLYIVFPLTYVLDASILSTYSIGIDNSTMTLLSNSASSLNSYISGSQSLSGQNTPIMSHISSYLSQITTQASALASSVENSISYFMMAAFILPAFSMMITFISIKELSAILGSEITFSIFDMV